MNSQYEKFKQALRDFLIQMKEFSNPEDAAGLKQEIKEEELIDRQAIERQRQAKVGGLLKPSEIAEDEE